MNIKCCTYIDNLSNKKSDKNINDGRVIDLSQYKRVNK